MPPRKKLKTAAVRNGSSSADGLQKDDRKSLLDTDHELLELPGMFHAAVDSLVQLVRAATVDNVTMFKIEVAGVAVCDTVQGVVESLSAQARDICEVVPLCEVRPTDLPANGCRQLLDQRHYAEALQHAVRAHFAFVEFDRRLIWTSAVGPRDAADTQLVYLFSYLRVPVGGAERAAPQRQREENRRRTMMVAMSSANIEDELGRFKNKLDRAEQELLDVTQSQDVEMRLPAPAALDVSLPVHVPRRSLGTALSAVLPRLSAATSAAARPAARDTGRRAPTPQKRPRAPTPQKRPLAHSREHSMDTDGSPACVAVPPTAGDGPVGPPTPSKTASALSDAEAAHLTAFFGRLNGEQSEQSRVSLTCRYAKLRLGRDVPSGVVYRLAERAGGRPPPPPPPLDEADQRRAALAVFGELAAEQSEQSRVAYTLQYMRVQHGVRISSGALFGWLGQAAHAAGKAARARR